MPQFSRYIGIDYSGAETADSSCKELRVYVAGRYRTLEPIQPTTRPRTTSASGTPTLACFNTPISCSTEHRILFNGSILRLPRQASGRKLTSEVVQKFPGPITKIHGSRG
jgi:hypothetical protein